MARVLVAVVALVALATLSFATTDRFSVDDHVLGSNGGIKFISGSLGVIDLPITEHNALRYIRRSIVPRLGLSGSERFSLARTGFDRRNNTHMAFQQKISLNNQWLEVDGGELILHVEPSGEVFALTVSVALDHNDSKFRSTEVLLTGDVAFERLMQQFTGASLLSEVELVILLHDDMELLAYRATLNVPTAASELPRQSVFFVRPDNAELIVEFSLIHSAEIINVFNANNKETLPGTLVRANGQPKVSDNSVNQAYDNSATCYEFYKKAFNRDSFDNKGAPMNSTVHYGTDYNNAFWNGVQMVYGDGDGVNFSDFAGDLSVVCHELTHAVVSSTANLRYRGESGALNEAWADMMGASSVIYDQGGLHSTTWEIGHECYLKGAALRYMNNPTQDGSSRDYYPERYTGILDNGGVHWNSGIANLAFVLMVQGGVHPRQKTTNYVEPAGIIPSLEVVYDALVHYMTATTDFNGARAATSTAAKKLFPNNPNILQTIEGAWTAVGVNGN